VNFSLADAAFEPLVGRQLHEAEIAAEAATTNDSLTDIALAYFDLVEAHALLANATDALKATDEMVRLATLFAKAGQGSIAEQYRAEAEQARWRQAVEDAQRHIVGRSVELARRLRLDAGVRLVPVDTQLVPVNMLPSGQSVEELVATGLTSRPELAQHQSLIEATLSRMRQEQWRPWLPSIQAGASAGTFGGGRSTNFDSQNERSDVDLLAVWELRNLGFGNMVMRRRAAVENRQAEIEAEMMRDRVVSEVVTAAADVESLRRQIQTAQRGIAAAKKSYDANLARIREAEGLPIELLQAIRARNEAQDTYSKSLSEFNRAQHRLLRAIGRPLGTDVQPPDEQGPPLPPLDDQR
ncbi:MAG: TolC family protein, partial [Planctomycetes bacterium]|nr:TolC family protein [Planctomycetota bacterium]